MSESVRGSIGTVHVAAPAALALALGLTYAGTTNEIGPWWLWASDACPNSPEMACGMVPMGPAVASLIAALTVGVFVRVFSR